MKRLLLLCAMGCAVIDAAAQHLYTLDECRALAVENNRQLRNARLDSEIATEQRREAFTAYFPQISASALAFQGSHPLVQADFALPGLGALPVELVKNGWAASVVAVQPIFAGLKIVNANKLASVGEEVGRLQYAVAANDAIEKTTDYFWQIVSLKEKLRTLDAVDRQIAEIRRQVELSVEAGLTTRNDLLRVELRQQEIASKRLEAGNARSILCLLLAQQLGVDRTGFDVAAPDSDTPESPLRYRIDPEEALVRRAEYELLQKNVEASRYRTRIERSKNLPSVGVGAGYTYYDLTDKGTDNGLLFAQISVPISSWWGGSHAIRRARLQEQQAENDRLDNRELLLVEIERCWHDLEEAYCQIALAQRSVASSEENLRLNRSYFEAGTSSLTDLLDAETLYRQSRDLYVSACAAYRNRLSKYLRATGR